MSQDYDIKKISPRPWEWHCDETEECIFDDNEECIFTDHLDDDNHNLMHIAVCVNFYERVKGWCLDRDMVPGEGEDFLDVIDRMNNTLIEALSRRGGV